MTSWQPEVRWETADRVEKGVAGSGDRKSRDLEGKTADRQEKGIAGSGHRKSHGLERKTADHCGLRVQSPNQAPGEVFHWRKMSDWSMRDHVIELLNSRWPPKLLEVFLSFGKC